MTAAPGSTGPAPWSELRDRLLLRVFYDHAPDEVAASTDLVGDGYLNSTSLLVALGLIGDEIGHHAALGELRTHDTASLAALERLYVRLCSQRALDGVD